MTRQDLHYWQRVNADTIRAERAAGPKREVTARINQLNRMDDIKTWNDRTATQIRDMCRTPEPRVPLVVSGHQPVAQAYLGTPGPATQGSSKADVPPLSLGSLALMIALHLAGAILAPVPWLLALYYAGRLFPKYFG
jgi:hypothetical protein